MERVEGQGPRAQPPEEDRSLSFFETPFLLQKENTNLKNKTTSYLTSEMGLPKNSTGIAVWDMQVVANHR